MTKAEKERLKVLLKKARVEQVAIATARDNLRDLRDEIDEIVDSSSRGLEDLERALDSLSEYL